MKKNSLNVISREKIWLRKFLWCMNQLTFLMLFGALSLSAKVYSQEDMISMKMKNVSLIEVFSQITQKTGYDFLYNYDLVKGKGEVNVKVNEVKLNEFLQEILAEKDLAFEFRDQVIVIKSASPKILQQVQVKREVTLKGKVTDETGHPMPGVSVYIKGSTIGVATDINGQYSLPFEEGKKEDIIFSFVGMKMVEYHFAGQNTVYNVVMVPDEKILEDVVVIGYGSKAKRDLTSAVSTVKADELMKSAGASANTFDNMLGGAVKGVMITQNSGQLGASATVNIRGITSPLAGTSSANEPLYVIDGVPFFNDKGAINPLSTIAADDIESIDVLKDAAATAIYGSRGANGVIIVKTKTGHRNQRMTVAAGYTFSVGNPVNEYNPLNTSEFKELQAEIGRNIVNAYNANPNDFMAYGALMSSPFINFTFGDDYSATYEGLNESKFGKANTNWVKEVKNKNALTHQYNLALRGGNEQTNYSFSFNGTNQEGLFQNDKLDRYGARLSVDSDISKRFKGGASLNYTFSKHKQGNSENLNVWEVRPDVEVYTNGKLTWLDGEYERGYPGILLPNPMAMITLVNNEAESYQFMGNSYLEYEVFKNLKIHGDINLSVFQDKSELFMPKAAQIDGSAVEGWGTTYSTLNISDSRTANSSVNLRVDYQWTSGEHQLNAMVGYGWDRSFYKYLYNSYQDFPDDQVLIDAQSAARLDSKTSSRVDQGLNSVYARVGYIYGDKYLAEANFRSDASSKFGPGNKRGYFPSVSLGWRLNNENFLSGAAGWMDNLKLRFSWGQTGSTNVDDFSYLQVFYHGNNFLWGGNSTVGLNNTLPNRDIKWEMTTEYNGGLDFAFWQNRLYGSIDAYYRYTDGALAPAPAPFESGFNTYTANVIDMTNRGMEVEVGGDIIRGADWKWSSSFNIAFNRNKIEKLNGATLDETQIDFYLQGEPAGVLKGYVVEKIFESENEVAEVNDAAIAKGHTGYMENIDLMPGDYKYKDIDGDGCITLNDRKVIASPEPQFFGGFFNSVSWKNLNLSFMFQFSKGATAILESLRGENAGIPMKSVVRELYGNTWTPENKDARYARTYMNAYQNYGPGYENDRYVFETSYLRLKNITLSYDLPQVLLRRVNIQGLQVFASVSNLWTWTNWPGIDPESMQGGDPGMGGNMRSYDPYPLSKTFSLGLKVQF